MTKTVTRLPPDEWITLLFNYAAEYVHLANSIMWKFLPQWQKQTILCGPFWVTSLAQDIPHDERI